MNEVVAAVQMRDFVLVFTKDGTVYRLYWDSLTDLIVVVKELVILE